VKISWIYEFWAQIRRDQQCPCSPLLVCFQILILYNLNDICINLKKIAVRFILWLGVLGTGVLTGTAFELLLPSTSASSIFYLVLGVRYSGYGKERKPPEEVGW